MNVAMLEKLHEQATSVLIAFDEADRAEIVKQAEKDVGRWFLSQGRLLLEGFPQLANYFFQAQEAIGDDFDKLWDDVADETFDKGQEIVSDVLAESAVTGYTAQAVEFGIDASFELPNPRAVAWAQENAAVHVTQVNDTTKGIIRNIVVDGLDEGKSFQKVAREIKDKFKEFAVGVPQERFRSRAELVAVTENAFAYESGSRLLIDDMGEIGIRMEKFWGGPNDDRTSDGCLANIAAGWIPKDDEFPSGDQQPPRFPGCRHSNLYQVEGGETDPRDAVNIAKAEQRLEEE